MTTASISGVTFRPLNTNTPGLLCIEGVWFVLHEDRSRLYSFGFTCKFCGQRQRTCSTASREESMRKHAAKASHQPQDGLAVDIGHDGLEHSV